MKKELINYFTSVHANIGDESLNYTEDGVTIYDPNL